MPHHRVLRASQDDAIALIEREGEVIVQVVNDPTNVAYVDIYTRYRGIVMETR